MEDKDPNPTGSDPILTSSPVWVYTSTKVVFAMRILTALPILFCLALPALAQDVAGTITGVATDSSGAVVPNVEVTVVNTGTNATWRSLSDTQGAFTIRR